MAHNKGLETRRCAQHGRDEAPAALVVNKLRGTLQVAAVEEGIGPGGGVALLGASAALESVAGDRRLDDDERIGVEIVRRACDEPMRWIAQNAGFEGSIVVSKVKESGQKYFGFNAQTERYEDLVKAGVIDPTKVVRTALTNAASIASLLLTTEALVSEIPEKEEAPAGPHGHTHGMEDY